MYTTKNGSIVHYSACGVRKKPIISMSLLSGLLWDELKCEFNLLGAKVNFRRADVLCEACMARCRSGMCGPPHKTDLCLAKGHHSVMCRSWYTSPYPPPCPNFTLIPPWSWGFAWIYADNPDSLLKPPPPSTLFTKTLHQTVQQGVISWTKGQAYISAVPILAFNFTNFKERFVFKMDSTFHLIITDLSLTETN